MLRHGWTLLFHECVTLQLRKRQESAGRVEQNDPKDQAAQLGEGDTLRFEDDTQ